MMLRFIVHLFSQKGDFFIHRSNQSVFHLIPPLIGCILSVFPRALVANLGIQPTRYGREKFHRWNGLSPWQSLFALHRCQTRARLNRSEERRVGKELRYWRFNMV